MTRDTLLNDIVGESHIVQTSEGNRNEPIVR